MQLINDELLKSLRDKWRNIPDHVKDEVPDLVSRVSLNENSSIIPISRTAVGFRVKDGGEELIFQRQDEAELFAAGRLSEREYWD